MNMKRDKYIFPDVFIALDVRRANSVKQREMSFFLYLDLNEGMY